MTDPCKVDVPPLACLGDVIARLIEVAFLFLGAVTVLFLLYGAIKFIISRGDPKAIEGARNTITYALIGAVLVLGSFILIKAVTGALGLPDILTEFTLFQPPKP